MGIEKVGNLEKALALQVTKKRNRDGTNIIDEASIIREERIGSFQ